jgi:predicted NBD/HSP70 family sugar kinase
LNAAGIDPSPLWLQPENWDGFGRHLDAWIADIAPPLAQAIAATCSVIDFPAVIIDGGFPPAVRSRITAATRSALAELDLEGIAPPTIVEGEVGQNARAIGGACLPLLNRYILDPTSFVKEAV